MTKFRVYPGPEFYRSEAEILDCDEIAAQGGILWCGKTGFFGGAVRIVKQEEPNNHDQDTHLLPITQSEPFADARQERDPCQRFLEWAAKLRISCPIAVTLSLLPLSLVLAYHFGSLSASHQLKCAPSSPPPAAGRSLAPRG